MSSIAQIRSNEFRFRQLNLNTMDRKIMALYENHCNIVARHYFSTSPKLNEMRAVLQIRRFNCITY